MKQITSLKEAFSRQDAPVLLQSAVNVMVREGYQRPQSNWRDYCVVDAVGNFRDINRAVITIEDDLEPIEENEAYPETKISEAASAWRVQKWGRILPISLEMAVNDDTRKLRDLAVGLGGLASVAEARLVARLLESLPVSNDADGNPLRGPLTDGLIQRAVNAFYERQDQAGREVEAPPAYVVTPPRHESALRAIFRQSTPLDFNPLGGEVQAIYKEAYLRNKNRVYILADKNVLPGIEVDFLRVPSDPREDYTNGPRVLVDSATPTFPLPGDIGVVGDGFKYDTVNLKVRHVFGGGVVDPLAIVVIEIA